MRHQNLGLGSVLSYPSELPSGMVDPVIVRDPSVYLPAWAPSGWRIDCYEEGGSSPAADPVVIHDRFGNIVHQWENGYTPSYTKIASKITANISRR